MHMLALEPLEESSGRDEDLEDEDLVELALLARLKGQDSQPEQQECTLAQATEQVLWALDAAKRGSAATEERPPALPWNTLAGWFAILATMLIVVVLLLALTRANFEELTLEGSALLAAGVPAYAGEEPLAATAMALEHRSLAGCASLPPGTLEHIREVSLVHRSQWRSLRIVRALRFSASHLWLEAADGSGIRLQGGRAFLREGKLGDEQRLALGGELYGDAGVVRPTAFFGVVASPL